jgi:alpha-galactosidase
LFAVQREWLPGFEGRDLTRKPTINIPAGLDPVDVPLDPALAIANRFSELAGRKVRG